MMNFSILSRATTGFVAGAVAVLLVSAFLGVTTEQTFAAKGGNENNYDVLVVDHVGIWPSGSTPDNLYAPGPGCPGDTPGTRKTFTVAMPDDGDVFGDSCGIVDLYDLGDPEPNGYQLRDGVGFNVLKSKSKGKEYLTAVILKGQDAVGPDSSWHESKEMPLGELIPLPEDSSQPFVLHVHSTVLVEQYDSHLDTGGNKPIAEVGYVSVGDLEFYPQ